MMVREKLDRNSPTFFCFWEELGDRKTDQEGQQPEPPLLSCLGLSESLVYRECMCAIALHVGQYYLAAAMGRAVPTSQEPLF